MNRDPVSEKGMGNFISLCKIMDTTKQKIDLCINEWKRRLIDLTRRNRLIYFIPKRSSSIQIAEPTPSEVFKRFVIDEKPLKCF
ncbi:MAG: DUF4011 domain-containing protein [bacterium]